MINMEKKDGMIREISVDVKKFIKQYTELSLYHATF